MKITISKIGGMLIAAENCRSTDRAPTRALANATPNTRNWPALPPPFSVRKSRASIRKNTAKGAYAKALEEAIGRLLGTTKATL